MTNNTSYAVADSSAKGNGDEYDDADIGAVICARAIAAAIRALPVPQEPEAVRLGDYVRMDESSPYFADWHDATMKVVGLHLAPDGALWADVIEGDQRHRGCGQYDGETTGIKADYLCRIMSAIEVGHVE